MHVRAARGRPVEVGAVGAPTVWSREVTVSQTGKGRATGLAYVKEKRRATAVAALVALFLYLRVLELALAPRASHRRG